jgi:transposase
MWVIPPEQNGEFVARMEDILDVYQRPYNPKVPVVCQDEKPVQLISDKRDPLPVRPGRQKREDYEYKREGVANIFMHAEPLAGWRNVNVRQQRTRQDWASEIKDLLDIYYPEAEKVCLVCDNLNTHQLGSLYETFAPEEARRLARRLDIHYTPKHGSWLNMAEIELSALSKQGLSERIPGIVTLSQVTTTWTMQRNERQKGIDWQFTTTDARIKLKRLYPHFQLG